MALQRTGCHTRESRFRIGSHPAHVPTLSTRAHAVTDGLPYHTGIDIIVGVDKGTYVFFNRLPEAMVLFPVFILNHGHGITEYNDSNMEINGDEQDPAVSELV